MLWSMIWSRRSYVPDDSQSIFRAMATERQSQTERERERERGASCLIFVFSALSDAPRPSITLLFFLPPLSFGGWRMMFIKGSRFSLHYLSPQIDWEHVRKRESLCTLSQHLHLSIIAGRKCPLSANHCQVSESPFRASDWVMFFFFLGLGWIRQRTQTHTAALSGVVTVTRRELYTHVSLCFTLGKVSPHQVVFIDAIKWCLGDSFFLFFFFFPKGESTFSDLEQ